VEVDVGWGYREREVTRIDRGDGSAGYAMSGRGRKETLPGRVDVARIERRFGGRTDGEGVDRFWLRLRFRLDRRGCDLDSIDRLAPLLRGGIGPAFAGRRFEQA
jgi:hypothetical protein